ncbi:MAG TPA: virulence factor [Acidimicrobiia bacterium]|nr:virulence factor [Acidimicrobiia bacterium]
MADKATVIYWRDIPAQVVSGQGRRATRAMLSDRFQEAIDRAATRAGLIGSDEYMAEWRKVEVEGEVETVAAALEDELTDGALDALVRNYGASS